MKKLSYIASSAVLVAAMAVTPFVAFGQTYATMPVLYNQSGMSVNSGAGPLAAGYYYVNAGPSQGGQQVYYYGNGTFYNATTMTYGGGVSDPNGTAGVMLNYSQPVTPGVPNTGAGGMATTNWIVLSVATLALVGSVVYISRKAYMDSRITVSTS